MTPERHAARDDRDLAHRVGAGRQHAEDRVPALVVGGPALVLVRDHHLALGPEHDPLHRVGEVLLDDVGVTAPRRQQRRLVDEIGQVGADHPGASSRPGRRGRCPGRAAPSGCGRAGSPRGRPGRAGTTTTRRSKRPGRSSAWSRTSGRLVAPSTITDSRGAKPSISVRIWLSVCSRSSWPPDRFGPPPRSRASDRVELVDEDDRRGGRPWPGRNRSRTREAPTPTIISTNSEADIWKNGTPASPATARASSVLPVPGRARQQHAAGNPGPEGLRYLSGALEEVDDLGAARPWPRRSRRRRRR